PKFQQLFLGKNDFIKAELKEMVEEEKQKKLVDIYSLVLERIYDFNCQQFDTMNIKKIPEEKTGLDRYYSFTPDFQFVRIKALEPPKKLSEDDKAVISSHTGDIEVLSRYIDLNKFEFTGFTIVRAMDVTESEVISAFRRDLIDQHSIFSADGIKLLESRLQVLFRRPDMALGIGALQGDQVMILKGDCNSKINCLFANSHHINLEDLKGSVWMQAVEKGSVLHVPDLAKKPDLVPAEQQAVAAGIKSMLLSPLYFQGKIIGLLEMFTLAPNDLGTINTMLLEKITPLFSLALKRGQDQLQKQVQAIIKEKCTAVHPSVEWRFEKAAIDHMERIHNGNRSSEMESIIFKDVVPFYGQSDIRGSSLARNKSIQQDLTQQLILALDVLEAGSKKRPWPLLREFKYRIETLIKGISSGISSGDENAVFSLLNNEVAPFFADLTGLDSEVTKRIKAYKSALDPSTGMIYNKRQEYENSVSRLNKALAGYIDQEDEIIQQAFPHYFEKRQTDGVDYMMYIGASMMENQQLAKFHIRDLTLWQLMLACGLALRTEQVKPELKISLDTCHLILINHTPLSIRFRFDEKRFDVDGAYDVRHEIIKSRLDKALIKGSGERLTQPGRIAMVYSNPSEGEGIRQHIDFLISTGKLNDDLEIMDLEDMPDVRGLKALRIGVNLKSAARDNIIKMKTG
ncbi:MAG: GAF domain-containing protein, partial [Desulfobacteraceae bacterium]|nr:GAF domain-containing protein [Desulfobacteraceae bacterium]